MNNDAQQFSILLPAANVDVFALSPELIGNAESLIKDWRFARVGLTVVGGDLRSAVKKYEQFSSPDLVIVETSDISQNFVEQLNQLASSCTEGTDAVIIGPENDVQLYRSLIAMGVRDYLVTPIAKEDLAAVIANILIEKKGIKDSRLVTVMGTQGGAGASKIAEAAAWMISHDLKQKTVMVDAGAGWSTLTVSFGLEPVATLGEAIRTSVVASDDDFKRLLYQANEHLTILMTGGDPLLNAAIDMQAFEAMIDRFMKTFPVVMVDLSHANEAVQKRMMMRAHEIILVTTPHLTALRHARSLLGEIKSMRNTLGSVSLIVNKTGEVSGFEIAEKEIKNALDFEPALYLKYEPKLFGAAEISGKHILTEKPAQLFLKDMLKIAKHAAAYQETSDNKTTKDQADKMPSLLNHLMDKIIKK